MAVNNKAVSDIDNLFLQEVRAFPRDEIEWEYYRVWKPEPYPWGGNAPQRDGKRLTRNDLCRQYAWSIPDPEAMEFVAKHLAPKAVEIGAGTGYWASLLAQMGVDMVCYDLYPPQHTGQNFYHSPRDEEEKLCEVTREVYHDVRAGNHLMAAQHPDRTLFLCWPPYDDNTAYLTLQTYRGKRLVYIGEDEGGCTGDDQFFALLNEQWEFMDSHTPMQWSGIHDVISVYERR